MNYQVWAIVGSASLLSALASSSYRIGVGLQRSRKKSDANALMTVIIEKKTEMLLTAPITNADIR
jgi:hypothetical protein